MRAAIAQATSEHAAGDSFDRAYGLDHAAAEGKRLSAFLASNFSMSTTTSSAASVKRPGRRGGCGRRADERRGDVLALERHAARRHAIQDATEAEQIAGTSTAAPRPCSGDMYAGVPEMALPVLSDSFHRARTAPKWRILTRHRQRFQIPASPPRATGCSA